MNDLNAIFTLANIEFSTLRIDLVFILPLLLILGIYELFTLIRSKKINKY